MVSRCPVNLRLHCNIHLFFLSLLVTYHDCHRHVDFETRAREGAVLVLPSGANREELVDPSRMYSYVKDHAVSWYQYHNGHNGQETALGLLNGGLYIVIGIDRADSWATAVFPPINADGIFKRKDLRFEYIEGNAKIPWKDDGKYIVQYQSRVPPKAAPGVVFLRLMAIALSPVEWTRYIAYTRPDAIPRYPILSAPKSELQERLQRFLNRFMDVSSNKYHMRKVCSKNYLHREILKSLCSASSTHRFLFFMPCC